MSASDALGEATILALEAEARPAESVCRNARLVVMPQILPHRPLLQSIRAVGGHATSHRPSDLFGFTSETRYFDKSGKLIGVRTSGDCLIDNPTCPDWTHYGAVPKCRVTNVTQLCKP